MVLSTIKILIINVFSRAVKRNFNANEQKRHILCTIFPRGGFLVWKKRILVSVRLLIELQNYLRCRVLLSLSFSCCFNTEKQDTATRLQIIQIADMCTTTGRIVYHVQIVIATLLQILVTIYIIFPQTMFIEFDFP